MHPLTRLATVVVLAALANTARSAEPAPSKHALLVGCTRYDNPQINPLEGPANDVILLRDVLKRLYGFTDEHMTTLSEENGKTKGAQYRPTRANIEREFAKLATRTKKGDRVVIFLAGHGSQQPDSKPDDPERFEPDGKEEVFLPADTGDWDGVNRIKNAIIDYEFRDWLKAIRKTGASIWVIVDACHSASMIRGEERLREVKAEELVPEKVLRAAQEKARDRLRASGQDPNKARRRFKVPPSEPDLVALYAAQSTEPTVEKVFTPEQGGDGKSRGLLTHTICMVLEEVSQGGSPLTYEELLQRVHQQYRIWQRAFPTPLVEGRDSKREVLGEKVREARRQFSLLPVEKSNAATRNVDAGTLHGLTPGSILRVYPRAGSKEANKPLGHLRVLEEGLKVLQARVVPVEFGNSPAPMTLPATGGRCELVHLELADQRLRIAIDDKTNRGEPTPKEKLLELEKELTKFADAQKSLLEMTTSPSSAQWLLRYDSLKEDKLYLVPATGWLLKKQARTGDRASSVTMRELPPQYGPVPEGQTRASWLHEHLEKIARVRNVLSLATKTQRFRAHVRNSALAVKIKTDILRFRDESDDKAEVVTSGSGRIVLHHRDPIVIQVRNQGRQAIDVTLLLLSEDYSISAVFPTTDKTPDNRVLPNNVLEVGSRMNAKAPGIEHLVIIAAAGKDVTNYANFSFLAQSGFEGAQEVVKRGGPGAQELGFNSPLGRLLRKAAYGDGIARGMENDEVADYAFQVISYELSPEKRPADKK